MLRHHCTCIHQTDSACTSWLLKSSCKGACVHYTGQPAFVCRAHAHVHVHLHLDYIIYIRIRIHISISIRMCTGICISICMLHMHMPMQCICKGIGLTQRHGHTQIPLTSTCWCTCTHADVYVATHSQMHKSVYAYIRRLRRIQSAECSRAEALGFGLRAKSQGLPAWLQDDAN